MIRYIISLSLCGLLGLVAVSAAENPWLDMICKIEADMMRMVARGRDQGVLIEHTLQMLRNPGGDDPYGIHLRVRHMVPWIYSHRRVTPDQAARMGYTNCMIATPDR